MVQSAKSKSFPTFESFAAVDNCPKIPVATGKSQVPWIPFTVFINTKYSETPRQNSRAGRLLGAALIWVTLNSNTSTYISDHVKTSRLPNPQPVTLEDKRSTNQLASVPLLASNLRRDQVTKPLPRTYGKSTSLAFSLTTPNRCSSFDKPVHWILLWCIDFYVESTVLRFNQKT